jgi:hypothetical protein
MEDYQEERICPFIIITKNETYYAWGDKNHLNPLTRTYSNPMICSGIFCMKYDGKTKTCKRTK